MGSLVLLAACVSAGSGTGRGERDWVAYGSRVYATPEGERFALYADAERQHTANATASSALRLAILSLGIDRPSPDYEFILSLLDFADGAADNDAVREFVTFFRPIVRRLANQQADFEAETLERRSLEEQLEALRQLEERLNSGGGG